MSTIKIEKILVYQLTIPLDYVYEISGGRMLTEIDSTIVGVYTNSGLIGWGESCPCGNNYLPNFPGGIRAGLDVVGPGLIGGNPLHVQRVYDRMNHLLAGHGYAKSAIDMACWDLLGKSTGLAVYELLGGDYGQPTPIVVGVPALTPDESIQRINEFRARGCRIFSSKAKGDPRGDLERMTVIMSQALPGENYICDANGGFTTLAAIETAKALREMNVVVEQPCSRIDECRVVRETTGCRMVLDEPINGIDDLFNAIQTRAADVLNLKVTRLGGISPLWRMIQTAISLNTPVTVQDAGGTDITRAALAHVAHALPPKFRHSVYDPYDWHSRFISEGRGAVVHDGSMSPHDTPGLGVEPDPDILGVPVAVYEAQV